MVIRLVGYSRPELTMALRTRSLDSSIDLLPRPTMRILGSPFDMSLSTSTILPSYPTGETVRILAVDAMTI